MKLAAAKQLCFLRTRSSIAEVHVVVSFARVLLSQRRTCTSLQVEHVPWSAAYSKLVTLSRRRSHFAPDQRELLYHVIYNVQLSCISLYYSVGGGGSVV